MALYESEAQIWFWSFLLISVIYPIVFLFLIVKADKPAKMDLQATLEAEEKASQS